MDRSVILGAVGDIALFGDVAKQTHARGPAWPMEAMFPVLRKADILFGNMESVVLPPDFPAGRIDPFGMETKFDGTPALKEAGFDFMNLANNHILDGGTVGMFHTRKVIESHGIVTGGIGKTQEEARQMKVIERQGLRFGFLCYAEDTNYTLGTKGPCHAYYDPETILEDIRHNRSKVDVLVVSVHADLEFSETPSVPRRAIARRFAQSGATLVLQHHPHVPQGVEMIGKSLIAYSLGNFCFSVHTDPYLRARLPNTARSFVLLATVTRDGVASFSRTPCEILPPPQQRPVPLTGKHKGRMLAYFEELDRMVQDDDVVRENWRRSCNAAPGNRTPQDTEGAKPSRRQAYAWQAAFRGRELQLGQGSVRNNERGVGRAKRARRSVSPAQLCVLCSRAPEKNNAQARCCGRTTACLEAEAASCPAVSKQNE